MNKTMAKINTTSVYLINKRLVVADNVTEAIGIYNEYYGGTVEIESVSLIKDNGTVPSSAALIRKS